MKGQVRSSDLSLAAVGAGLLLIARNLNQVDAGVRLSLELVAWGCLAVVGVRASAQVFVDSIQRRRGLQATSLVRLMVSFVLYFVAAAALLRFGLHMELSRVLGASALLTAVAGFALQATLDNLFSGLALQVEEPFSQGQIVRVGDAVGRVEAMTWRAVHLRTEEQSLIVLPNSSIGTEGVEVLSGDQLVERTLTVDVAPEAPPARVTALLEAVAAGVPNVAAEPPVEVYPVGLRDFLGCRTYEIQYFPMDYLGFEGTEAEIRTRAWYALTRFGLSLNDPRPTAGRGPLLARVPLLAGLEDGERDALAAASTTLLFAEGEGLDLVPPGEPSLWVLARGRVLVSARDSAVPLGPLPELVGGVEEGWSRRELRDLTAELTEHLGPVSRLLVQKEARRTADAHRLRHLLADHIEDPGRRARFLGAHDHDRAWEVIGPAALAPRAPCWARGRPSGASRRAPS